MIILDFLRELAAVYATLNPTVTLCYHMGDNELFVGNIFGTFAQKIPSEQYEHKPLNSEGAFKQLINCWTADKKVVKCVYVDGMYFIPGNIDEAIIFGKDLHVLIKDSWMIEGVSYEIVRN